MIRRIALLGIATVMALLAVTVSGAWADTFVGNIFLNPTNSTINTACGGGLCPGPYASVTITTNGTDTANVVFQALATGGRQYLFIGKNEAVELVLSTTSLSVQNLSAVVNCAGCTGFKSPGTLTPNLGSVGGGGNGTYNFWVDFKNGGYDHAVSMVAFDLKLNSGTWGAAASVINNTQNSQSWVNSITGQTVTSISWAGAHIAVCGTAGDCNPGSAALATAWAGGAVIASIPEPGILALLGSSLILVGTVARRFKKSL